MIAADSKDCEVCAVGPVVDDGGDAAVRVDLYRGQYIIYKKMERRRKRREGRKGRGWRLVMMTPTSPDSTHLQVPGLLLLISVELQGFDDILEPSIGVRSLEFLCNR